MRWNAFSRRSRRDENCRKLSTDERARVMAYLPGVATLLGGGAGRRAGEVRQAGKIALLQDHREGLLVGEHVLAELGPEACQPLVDGGKAFLRGLLERGAGAHETGVVALQNPRLLGVRPSVSRRSYRPAMRGIECAIEIERVVVAGEQRGDVPLYGLDLRPRCRLPPARRTHWRRAQAPARSSPAPRSCCRSWRSPVFAAMASISARCSASARSKAGRKCSA